MILDTHDSAWAAGQPFNRFITLLWERGGIASDASVQATGAFITLARAWLRERGYPMPWAWVQEYGETNGAHCHIVLHVPPELAPLFSSKPRKWARKVLGGQYYAAVVQTQKLTMGHEREVLGKLHYMLKRAPAALEAELGMIGLGTAAWGQRCPVLGKRAAASQRRRKGGKT